MSELQPLKIVYVDVGTHFAQEYLSIFGNTKYFALKIARRFLAAHLLGRGQSLSFSELKYLIRERHTLRKMKKSFLSFFVEANVNVIRYSEAYKKVDGVFNCALTNDEQVSLIPLYLGNGNKLDEGSSIFLNKGNVNEEEAVLAMGVPAKMFFASLKIHIDRQYDNYIIILRLNCEGVEDDVIYSAHQVFSRKLVLIMGSLKDVMECKGSKAYQALEHYMSSNELEFVPFSSSPVSWVGAHKKIYDVCRETFE